MQQCSITKAPFCFTQQLSVDGSFKRICKIHSRTNAWENARTIQYELSLRSLEPFKNCTKAN